MTHEEFVEERLRKVRSAAMECAAGNSDPVDACLEIVGLASEIGDRGDFIRERLAGIESQLDEIPRGDALKLAGDEFRAKAEQEKADANGFFGAQIRQRCSEIVALLDKSAL
jgi:hypothetical protein